MSMLMSVPKLILVVPSLADDFRSFVPSLPPHLALWSREMTLILASHERGIMRYPRDKELCHARAPGKPPVTIVGSLEWTSVFYCLQHPRHSVWRQAGAYFAGEGRLAFTAAETAAMSHICMPTDPWMGCECSQWFWRYLLGFSEDQQS